MTLSSHDHGMEILAGRWQAQDIAQELASCHVYAAEFGTVLEWCTERTNMLFADEESAFESDPVALLDHDRLRLRNGRVCKVSWARWAGFKHEGLPVEDEASAFGAAMARAAVAYTQIRDARRVERVLRGEAA